MSETKRNVIDSFIYVQVVKPMGQESMQAIYVVNFTDKNRL